jgi:hypothetical protein
MVTHCRPAVNLFRHGLDDIVDILALTVIPSSLRAAAYPTSLESAAVKSDIFCTISPILDCRKLLYMKNYRAQRIA